MQSPPVRFQRPGSKTLRDRAVRTVTDLDVLVCPNRNWTVSPSRSHTCRSVRLDRHDYEHRSRGKWCARKRRRLKSRLQKSEEEIPKIGLWIRLTRKQSAKRCSTRQLPTPFLPAMRHRPCRIQAKILSRSRHRKAFQFSPPHQNLWVVSGSGNAPRVW